MIILHVFGVAKASHDPKQH